MRYIIGIDEVGRGPLAGPVVLAAAAIPMAWRPRKGQGRLPLKDSKKMTSLQRELWSEYFSGNPRVKFAISKCFPGTIDDLNIARAANNAARRALCKVLKILEPEAELCGVYLDGGLYLQKLRHPRKKASVHTEKVKLFGGRLTVSAQTVVRGDEKLTPVKIASILAKVHRDGIMKREAKRFPGYGFEKHMGYSTRFHREAIARLGPTKIHRLTFRSNSAKIQEN